MKSPIKLPSNDFKSTVFLREIIPPGKIVHSYLFFSGILEFDLAKNRRFVVGHTNRFVIYEFWRCVLEDPRRIAEIASRLYPIKDEPIFNLLQENWAKYKDPYIRSGIFFLLNRCSDSGLIASGKLENSNFSPISLSYLKNFHIKNFHVQLDESEDFLDDVKNIKDSDYLLFPIGRYTQNLFEVGKSVGLEETKVYHNKVKELLESTDKRCILIYFKHKRLFGMYKDHNITMIDKWGRKTNDKEKCEEMVIANF